MAVKQLSIFVENRIGRLSALTKIFADEDINLRAAVIVETTDFGILRCIVADPERAAKILNAGRFNTSMTDVTPVVIDDRSGGLHKVLALLSDAGIDVKYLYSSSKVKDGRIVMILKTVDTDAAETLLKENGFRICGIEDLV